MKIVVHGIPKPQQRHRTVRMGGFLRNYDPCHKTKQEFADKVRLDAPKKPLVGDISLVLTFYIPRPKMHFKTVAKKVSKILKPWAEEIIYCKKKPDVDNLVKYVMDSCQNLLWEDDCTIVEVKAKKIYTEAPEHEPKTEIEYCLVKD